MNGLMERVEKGAELLDQVWPGWDRYMDTRVGALDLGDPCRCVLGQLYGSFGEGIDTLGFLSQEVVGAYGFDTNGTDSYSELNQAWRSLLHSRRAAA